MSVCLCMLAHAHAHVHTHTIFLNQERQQKGTKRGSLISIVGRVTAPCTVWIWVELSPKQE